MTILLFVMSIIAILFIVFVIRNIHKGIFLLEDALLWLSIGFVMLLFSMIPAIPNYLSSLFGFEYTSNFLLFVAILFILVQLIKVSAFISKQSNRTKILIQEISLLKNELEKDCDGEC